MKTALYIIFCFLVLNCEHAYAEDLQLHSKIVDLPGDIEIEKTNKIIIDSKGILWIGTNDGLYQLNSQNATLFKNKGSNYVTALVLANDNQVWAGYKDGSLARFGLDTLFLPNMKTDSIRKAVSDIVFDQSGNLWWSTFGNGVFCKSEEVTIHLNINDGLSDNYIYDLEVDEDGNVWAASDRGISICKIDSNLFDATIKCFSKELPDLIVRVIQKDNKGKIWLGFHQGGYGYFDPASATFHPSALTTNQEFGQINEIEISEDLLWIADGKNGLFLNVLTNQKPLIGVQLIEETERPYIKSITSDQSGYLWILTKKALFVSNGGGISVSELNAVEDPIHAILSIDQNEFWTAGNNRLVQHKNNNVKEYLNNLLNATTQFTSLINDNTGRIWAGTLGEGIFILDPINGTYENINEKNGLINNNVLSLAIYEDIIWAGTLGGASEIKLDNEKNVKINSFDKEHGLGNNFIYTVFIDRKGRLWLGTDGNGLLKYEDGVFYTYDESHGIEDDVVYSIAEDDDGQIWFSTSDASIYSFNGNIINKYDDQQGLHGETIFSIASFKNSLFALTDEGLNILDRSNNRFVCLNEELGFNKLQSDLNSVSTGENCICFGTYNKLIRINTNLYSENILEPRTTIKNITVNLEPINTASDQSFSYNENRFIFEYEGRWPLAPNKLQYMVKLDGYDPDWKNTYDRSAIYPNLTPGKYVFHVKAFLSKTKDIGTTSTYSFIIYPPFYSSTWFIISLIIIFIAIVFWIMKAREKRLRLVESRKKEQLEFEFQTLRNQVNPHFLFNSFSTLISIIEDNPEEAVNYTEALSGFFRDILEVKEQQLILIAEELRMLKNYSLIHQKRFGENFKIVIQLDNDTKSTKIPPLTLQLLAENALKHNVIAKGKPLSVIIKNTEKMIIVENYKRQKKKPEQSTGIGLRNISERYKLISGSDIIIEETSEIFRVKLPIIKN